MQELYWITKALASIQANQRNLERNQRLILERLDEFKNKLEELGKQIDEQILVDFRTGMQHLLASFNSDLDDVRNEEFRMARGIFSKLINLNPKEVTRGTSGEIENPYLICMGYWGSFQYFSLQGDQRNAMIHAFECTRQYPGIALIELELFPLDLFSKDYATLTKEAAKRLDSLTALLQKNREDKFLFYGKQGLRIVTAGAASAGAGVVAGIFTGGVGSMAAAAAAFHGVYGSLEVSKPKDLKVEDIKGEIERLQTQLTDLESELMEECETRREALQKISLKDFKRIGSFFGVNP